jgi:hypothetical protein
VADSSAAQSLGELCRFDKLVGFHSTVAFGSDNIVFIIVKIFHSTFVARTQKPRFMSKASDASPVSLCTAPESMLARIRRGLENFQHPYCRRRIAYFCIIATSVALLVQKLGSAGFEGSDTPFRKKPYMRIQRILRTGQKHTPSLHHPSDGHATQNALNSTDANNTTDNCSRQWTGEALVGRCWGLTTSTAHPEIKNTRDGIEIQTADHCKQICCKLGPKCITWQYWAASKICKIGKHVRLGSEGGDSPRWCEPNVPQKWNGGKRDLILNPFNQSLTQKNFECIWATQLPGQCFQLGPDRKHADGISLSATECAKGCCSNPNCWLWQHLPNRGCFYNEDYMAEEPFCDQYVGEYIGGRKHHG